MRLERLAACLVVVSLVLSLWASPPRARAQRLAANAVSTCVIRPSGAVVCWQRGQAPRVVLPNGARSIAVSRTFACAVTTDGHVSCWGELPQLSATEPRVLEGLASVRAIAAGEQHLCALLEDGTVTCTGWRFSGDYIEADQILGSGFQPVRGLSGVAQIVSGYQHVCARLANGTVKCWGDGSLNQLGEGRYDSRAAPVTARLLGRAEELVAGEQLTCARAASGDIKCVGSRFDATGSPRSRTAWTPALLPRADALAAGPTMICGLHRGADWTCAGFNTSIAMGEGDYTIRIPTGVVALTDGEEAAIGGTTVCFLRTGGAVACLGDGASGAAASDTVRSTAVQVAGLTGVTRMSASFHHTCALGGDGVARCWGTDDPADLLATSGERPAVIGRRAAPVALRGVQGAAAVFTSGATTGAVSTSGVLSLFGAGPFEPMGRADGDGSDRRIELPAARERVEYALGIQTICARTQAGTVVCVGSGQHGEWGTGEIPSTDGDAWFRRSWAPVSGWSDALAVRAAWNTQCALRRDRSVWCWGENASGVIASGAPAGPIARPQAVPGLADVQDFALGGRNGRVSACARATDGAVWCWGANRNGQSAPRDSAQTVGPTRLDGVRDARAIAVGERHACAASADGTVSCWGDGSAGQCGGNALSTRMGVTRVAGVRGAVELAAGAEHTCARVQDGTVWCWGQSSLGALGNGESSLSSGLVDVSLPPG